MKKRLGLLYVSITMLASIADVSGSSQYAMFSRVYNEPFMESVDQSATIGLSGSLDETFNQTTGSIGSIDLSAQLSENNPTARAVLSLPDSSYFVAISDTANHSNLAKYTTQGVLESSFSQGGIIDLGNAPQVQSMIFDAQSRILICGGDLTPSSGWFCRVQADGSGRTIFVAALLGPWSIITSVATQSNGAIIAVGSNGTNAMIARYLVDGGIDTTFGNQGYVILNGSGQLPISFEAIGALVIDDADKIYIPYVQDDTTIWIIRLLANGTPDASWFRSFYGAMVPAGHSFTVGTLTTTTATTATYHTNSSMPSYSGLATFSVGSSSPYYTGTFTTAGGNNGTFRISGAFITNRIAVPYLNDATSSQMRMALDVNNNLIIAAQVGDTIKVMAIQTSDGQSAPFDRFTSSVITSDQLNLYALLTTQDNSILLAGSNQVTGELGIIKLIGTNIYPGTGTLDTTFNGTGYQFYQSNTTSTSGAIYNVCLSPDGRIYAANYQIIDSVTYPYLSRLYNSLYDAQAQQYPKTIEQGIVDLTFGHNATQTYQGIITPYCGNYRGALQQQAKTILDIAYPMLNSEDSGVQDLLIGTDGFLNNSNSSNMILTWLTPDGLLDTNFGESGSGQLALLNMTSANEYVSHLAQDAQGAVYIAGNSSQETGVATLRKYTNTSTSQWTTGNSDWDQTLNLSDNMQGSYVALQGTGRALLFGYDAENHGFIAAYDQSTGQTSNGSLGASTFGDNGTGVINYNSYGLSMGEIYSAVVNNAGDIFVAYQNVDPGYVNVAGFKPDGLELIAQFGTAGVVGNLFSPFVVSATDVQIAQDYIGNLLVCAADDTTLYLARLDGVTGQLDPTFHADEQGFGVVLIPAPMAHITKLQGLSDGSILIAGSLHNNAEMVIIKITADGYIDEDFNAQGAVPGYESIIISPATHTCALQSLAIQSGTGNIVTAGYETISDTDATPCVIRSFGKFGTTGVMSYSVQDIYPGSLDTSFNGTGALNLSNVLGAGTITMVYAYPSGNQYQGMLLVGLDNGTTTQIFRVNQTYMLLDYSFGQDGVYTVTPNLQGLSSLFVDAQNNIIVGGTAGSCWAQQLSPNGQSSISFDLPSTVTEINAIGQQKSGRYIIAANNIYTHDIMLAYQNQLVDDATMLALDTTFNPLGIVSPVGTYVVGGFAGGLRTLAINNDDTILTTCYNQTNQHIVIAQVLANGSDLNQNFGAQGLLDTNLQTLDATSIQLAIDQDANIILAALSPDQDNTIIAARYDAAGGTSTSFSGTGVVDGVQTVVVAGITTLQIDSLLQTQEQQTIILGTSLNPSSLLYAIRLDATGALDETWNPYATSPNVPGILTYAGANANIMGNGCIGISGNIWVGATYQSSSNAPIIIEINGDTYVQQVAQSPLAGPAGTLDYTLNASGALNLNTQLAGSFGIPRQVSILSNQSMLIACNNGNQTQLAQLNPILALDTFGFNAQGITPGYVTIDNANSVNDLFVANASGQDGSIYLTGGANVDDSNVMWAAHVDADGQNVTTVTAENSLDNACAIRLGNQGQILIAGHQRSTGVVVALTSDLTAIDTVFGTDGYYTTGINSVIGAMTVDSLGRIYIAYVVNNDLGGTLYLQRVVSDGTALDLTFGDQGTVSLLTSESSYSQTQLFLQIDETNGYVASAALDQRGQFIQVNRWNINDGQALGNVAVYVGATAESSQLSLSHLFLDTHANMYVIGYMNVAPYNTIVARITTVGEGDIQLDATYAVNNIDYPGVAAIVAGPLAGPGDYSIGSAILDQDGRVYIVGNGGNEQPYMARLFGDNYYQQVLQAVSFIPTGPGTFDADYGTDGIATTYAGGITSGQQVRAILPRTTGTDIITVVTSQDGTASWTVRLLSDGSYDMSYGDGQGIAITQNATGAEICQGMIIDGENNMIVFGSNSVAGGYVKSILPDGAMNTAFGPSGNGMTYLSEFDAILGLAQLSNGQFVIVGYKGSVGVVGLLSAQGSLLSLPAVMNFGTNITSVSCDSLDNIYIAYASGLSIVANVVKLSASFEIDTQYAANATAVLTNINDAANIRLALDSDGQIIVAATELGSPGAVSMIRLNSDGTIDSSFHEGSPFSIVFDPGTSAPVTSLVPLQNGNYLVAGYQYYQDSLDDSDYEFVASILSDGSYDRSFNNTGQTPGLLKFQVASGPVQMRNLWNMSVQNNGNILLAGSEESLELIDTPLTMRLHGYTDVPSVQQYPGYVQPVPSPINSKFGIAFSSIVENLADGGCTSVDSLQRVIVSGITVSDAGKTFVVARFLQDGTLDPEFNGTGIAQSPLLTNLSTGFFVAVDAIDNIYVAGVTDDEACIVAKFLGLDGSLDTDFNHDGVITSIPGVAQSYTITNLITGGHISIDYLGNILVGGMTSDQNLAVTRFRSNGSIDEGFGQVIPGISTVAIPHLNYGGYVATDPLIIRQDNSIYLGACTTDTTLLIVKLDRFGSVDVAYADFGIAQTAAIENLVGGGLIALNGDRKVVIGGFTLDHKFVAARFGLDGFFDPTFNGNGVAYSHPLSSLNSCSAICIDSNNNVLLSGLAVSYDQLATSMVVARMTVLGAIDTTLSVTGMVTTGAIEGLQSGGYVATDALSNIFVGGFDTTKLVVAGLYSGAQIFINNAQNLPASVFKIYWYGNNVDLFKDYLAIDFYAQVITNPIVRAVVIDQVIISLDEYAAYAQGQPGFNLAGCISPTWDGKLSRLQAFLITTYEDATDDINQFFDKFNSRRNQIRDDIVPFNS